MTTHIHREVGFSITTATARIPEDISGGVEEKDTDSQTARARGARSRKY